MIFVCETTTPPYTSGSIPDVYGRYAASGRGRIEGWIGRGQIPSSGVDLPPHVVPHGRAVHRRAR